MPAAAPKRRPAMKPRTAKIIDFESIVRERNKTPKPPARVLTNYLNGLGAKQNHPAKSFEQLRQRELAWALYITEGYCANLLHALKVNCVTFNERDKALIGRILANVESDGQKIREWLKQI